MIKAAELQQKFKKEFGKSFRSEKGLQTRIIKSAKAGMYTCTVDVSPKAKDQLVKLLDEAGYNVIILNEREIQIEW